MESSNFEDLDNSFKRDKTAWFKRSNSSGNANAAALSSEDSSSLTVPSIDIRSLSTTSESKLEAVAIGVSAPSLEAKEMPKYCLLCSSVKCLKNGLNPWSKSNLVTMRYSGKSIPNLVRISWIRLRSSTAISAILVVPFNKSSTPTVTNAPFIGCLGRYRFKSDTNSSQSSESLLLCSS